MIREAISKVKDAVASKDVVPYMTHYLVKDNMIHATNGRVTAAAPFPDDRVYLVPARAFEKTLERMPSDDIKIVLDDQQNLKISCGRYRAKLLTLKQQVIIPGPEGQEAMCPPDFAERLRAVRHFLSDNATQPFALCVLITGNAMYATNNISVAVSDGVGLPEMYCMLPVWAVDFVLKRDTSPSHVQWTDSSISFRWDDGSWMRSQLFCEKFPPSLPTIVEDIARPEWEIPSDWRDLFRDVCSMSENADGPSEVHIYPDKLVGGHLVGDMSVEIETPVPEGTPFTRWNPKFLLPVVENATHLDLTIWPKPCPFHGPLVRGVVLGFRK